MCYMNLGATYEKACTDYAKKTSTEITWKSQAVFDKEKSCFYLPFYTDELVVTYPGGQVSFKDREDEVPIAEKILALHYLADAQGTPVSERWIPFREIPGGHIYVDPFHGRALYPLLKNFGKNPDDFEKAALNLNGKKREMGDISFEIPVFPMVSLLYILWLGDEEVPASGNILFNESAPDYLPTEDYAIIGGLTIGKLKKALS